MIARLIELCVRNRAMVLILTAALVAAGVWAVFNIKVDAIPDLSDVQVIIRTEYAGQAPKIVEDQVTYPLTTAMLAVPRAKVVRGYSMFGFSFVYIIFDDGTDPYWARSRVLERLSFVQSKLPPGLTPQLGPDATGVGWVYEYVLTTGKYCPRHPNGLWQDEETGEWYDKPTLERGENTTGKGRKPLVHHRMFPDSMDRCPRDGTPLEDSRIDLARLRGLQDWYLRYELTGLENVSEVAAVGGFEKQYQVVVDPVKLLAYKLSLNDVTMAIARSNRDTGGRLIEMSETEYMVRGLGYLGALSDREILDARAAGQSVEELRTARVLEQLGKVSLGHTSGPGGGAPIYLSNVAGVQLGPEIRRGLVDWNGQGEAVGGIVLMRSGENARVTIERVRQKLGELEEGLPPGVAIETGYDRSDLIDRAVHTLTHTLVEEMIVVGLVCILFLLHARSELVAVFVVPTGVLASVLLMHLMGINANVMSLGGIAIAIGVMVDSSIIMVENAHKHLDRLEEQLHARPGPLSPRAQRQERTAAILAAAREVGPSLFFALLIITVSFLPIFVLGEQSGRLFKPLAFTKTFAMASAAFLAVTVIPVLMTMLISARVLPDRWPWWRNLLITLAIMLAPAAAVMLAPLPRYGEYRPWFALAWVVLSGMLLVPQRIIHEHANPISRLLQWLYHPFFIAAMRFRWVVLLAAALAVASIAYPLRHLGSEFMPPLEEGDLLYMPTTEPGISMTKAREIIQQTDAILKTFPEVKSVMGKIGNAETATDPAPPSMVETTITLHRDMHRWRHVPVPRFFDRWPESLRKPLAWLWPGSRPITTDELIYGYTMPADASGKVVSVPGMNEELRLPGLTNSWTMPIKTRLDMLSTGIKTPVGVKIMGPDLKRLSELADHVAQVLKTAEGTGAYTLSAFAEKTVGGDYLDVKINRDEIARYGMTVGDVQDVVATAMGGMMVTTTVEGLERYSVNVRYPRELRDNVPALRQMLVTAPARGAAMPVQVPLGQLAQFDLHKGPDMIKSENARLTSWVYVDIAGTDVGAYVDAARRAVASAVALPPGYSLVWSGQYEYMLAARARLRVAAPLALVLIVLLLYASMHSWLRVGVVLLAVPFSLIGAFWLIYLMGYQLSLAVWVGVIALAGLDAETGMVMLLYLDNSFDRFRAEGRMRDANDLWHAVHDGAVKRIRPKTMTVMATFVGLVPLLWAHGAGADTMRRLAVPMIGGLATSFIMELLIYPVIFYSIKRWQLPKHPTREQEFI